MKKIANCAAILLIVAIALGLFAFPASAERNEEFAAEVLRLVNVERARVGLSPLQGEYTALNAAAQQRAVELHTQFSHYRPDGSDWSTILAQFNISWTAIGENIARYQTTPAAVVNDWMRSRDHRRNILNANYTYLGVGVHVDEAGHHYWAQLFLRTDPLNTILGTRWLATTVNWLLFFLGFGWIWMWIF